MTSLFPSHGRVGSKQPLGAAKYGATGGHRNGLLRNLRLGLLLLCLILLPASQFAADHPQLSKDQMARAGARFTGQVGSVSVEKLRERLLSLNQDISQHGILDFPGAKEKLLTGYSYGEFYDWDLYFENLYLSYYGISDYNFSNLKLFLDRQQGDGFVSRTLKEPRPTQMFKPFLAQIAVLGSTQRHNDYSWLRDGYYEKLQKYIDRWFAYDADHNGLPVWNSADASGMDNQYSRAGVFDAFYDEGVDLECYLVRELRAMAVIANQLGKHKEAEEYAKRARRLSTTINTILWDDKDGFYYDRDQKTGQRIRVKSVAGFLPLWAGVATPAQARRLVKQHLLNEKEFWTKYPVPSYALTEPDYYQGSKTERGECNWRGTTWIPTNYMIFHGLVRYGFKQEARTLADRTFDLALNQNASTREYYDADTGQGNGLNPFWGWSSLAYAMPLEYDLGYDPTNLDAPIFAILPDTLGISFHQEQPVKK